MIEEKLKDILAAVLEISATNSITQVNVENTEEWDSVKHLLLMSTIEQEFSINLDDDDLISLTSYSAIKNRLEKEEA